MKLYTTLKTGYTAGIYGCSGEYFLTIIITNGEVKIIHHYGMYGSEERINTILRENGYTPFYTHCAYGKLTKKDIPKAWYMTEYQAIEEIKILCKN